MGMNAEEIDYQKKFIYLDPLSYTPCNNYKDPTHRERVVQGGHLLSMYIKDFSKEIFQDLILPDPMMEPYIEDKLDLMFERLMEKGRSHGWGIVKFYTTQPYWKIYSILDKKDWIYNKKSQIIGMEIEYTSKDGMIHNEKLLFNDFKRQCFYYEYSPGDGKKILAYPDIDLAMWTMAAEIRQIKFTENGLAVKPEFYLVSYGKNITPGQRSDVMAQLDVVDPSEAIGASPTILEKIESIPRANPEFPGKVIDKRIRFFSGKTRLPLDFYIGERENASWSDAGERASLIKIFKRKKQLFRTMFQTFKNIYKYRYNIIVENVISSYLEEPEKLKEAKNNERETDQDNEGEQSD